MRILQIGAGSMGTRRLRDLRACEGVEVTLFDQRADRRAAAASRFGVATTASLDEAMATEPDALVISTPPDQHTDYVRLALDTGRHFFCEADIWAFDPRVVAAANARRPAGGLVAAPSCTLYLPPLRPGTAPGGPGGTGHPARLRLRALGRRAELASGRGRRILRPSPCHRAGPGDGAVRAHRTRPRLRHAGGGLGAGGPARRPRPTRCRQLVAADGVGVRRHRAADGGHGEPADSAPGLGDRRPRLHPVRPADRHPGTRAAAPRRRVLPGPV